MEKYDVIGVMSGTSGDGLDLAACTFIKENSSWSFEIKKSKTVPFPLRIGNLLSSAFQLSALDLAKLDVDFGSWVGDQIKSFGKELHFVPQAVCAHGHTVFHQPKLGFSLQIGNGWALRERSGIPVINDFRMQDIQLGGQGAPLVPIGDQLLFSDIDFCINLGGISNISMEIGQKRIAFDISPFNLLLNHFAKKLGADYDKDGSWAAEGITDKDLFSKLNAIGFYSQKGAKSLGREDIEQDFLPLLESSILSPKDILSTLVEHFSFQIAEVIKKYKSTERPKALLTGGGAYHRYFIDRLDHCLDSQWNKIPASKELIEFKEALIFGFLGVLRLRGEANCLASVTGAKSDSCGGTYYP